MGATEGKTPPSPSLSLPLPPSPSLSLLRRHLRYRISVSADSILEDISIGIGWRYSVWMRAVSLLHAATPMQYQPVCRHAILASLALSLVVVSLSLATRRRTLLLVGISTSCPKYTDIAC
jgi:hypothetical protein